VKNKTKKYCAHSAFLLLILLGISVFMIFQFQGDLLNNARAQEEVSGDVVAEPVPEDYDVEITGLDEPPPMPLPLMNEIPAISTDEIADEEAVLPMPPELSIIPEELAPAPEAVAPEQSAIPAEPVLTEQLLPEEAAMPPVTETLTDEEFNKILESAPVEAPVEELLEAQASEQPAVSEEAKPQAKPQENAEEKPPLPVANVSLDFKEADIRNVLRILAYKSGVNIVASPEVSGLVTIRLTDVPWDKAMEVILTTYGYGYERKENIIAVYPMETLTAKKREQAALAEVQPTVTKVIRLRFIDAIDMKKTLDPQLSARGKITVLEMTGQAGWAFGGTDLGKRARLSERQGRAKMIIVSDIPPVLEKLEQVVAKLDVQPEQVLIETRILEVNRDKLKDLGIEFGTGSTGDGFVETSSKGGGSPPGPETQMKIKSQTLQVAPSTFNPKVSLGGTTALFAGGLTAYFQKVTGTQFQAILHAVEEDVETNTLSAPRILTLSNQEATILVGTKYPILTSEVSTENAQTVTTTLDYYQDIGIQLNVVPQVNDDGYINLIVHPAVTSASSYVGTNLYPVIETRETETQILIKDGETVVIGGLLKDVKGVSEVGIPFLSKIPILGALFTRNTVDTQKIDLLIFITARVVRPDEDLITLIGKSDSPIRSLLPNNSNVDKPKEVGLPKEQKTRQ
jgi:type IV pilus assembly protein PilQ